MEAQKALEIFLNNVLAQKRERYLGFITKQKTRNKFLNSIYHELEDVLDKSKRIDSLPEDISSKPAFVFKPPNTFGERVLTLRTAIAEHDESFLVISEDGKFGIHGPETIIDSRAFYAAK